MLRLGSLLLLTVATLAVASFEASALIGRLGSAENAHRFSTLSRVAVATPAPVVAAKTTSSPGELQRLGPTISIAVKTTPGTTRGL